MNLLLKQLEIATVAHVSNFSDIRNRLPSPNILSTMSTSGHNQRIGKWHLHVFHYDYINSDDMELF